VHGWVLQRREFFDCLVERLPTLPTGTLAFYSSQTPRIKNVRLLSFLKTWKQELDCDD
jgi:hypothetical protein